MGWREDQREWHTNYYRSAIGLTIVDFKWREEVYDEDDPTDNFTLDEPFPVLICKAPDGELVELDISRDPEGNGPGFVFGLEVPS